MDNSPNIGAFVRYCDHEGFFIADIVNVGNATVIRANGPVTPENLNRANLHTITHWLCDYPTAGFWRPDLGVFVVPKKQLIKL